jgi:hypothetical protein
MMSLRFAQQLNNLVAVGQQMGVSIEDFLICFYLFNSFGSYVLRNELGVGAGV